MTAKRVNRRVFVKTAGAATVLPGTTSSVHLGKGKSVDRLKRLAEWVAVYAGGRKDQHPLAKDDERLRPG